MSARAPPAHDQPTRQPTRPPPARRSSSSPPPAPASTDFFAAGALPASPAISPPARALAGAPGSAPPSQSTVTFQEPAAPAVLDPHTPAPSDKLGAPLGPTNSAASSLQGLATLPILPVGSNAPSQSVDAFSYDPEQQPVPAFSAARPNPEFKRKRSLVRPDRERMDPSHRQWYYRNHAAQMEASQASQSAAMPSHTGHLPSHGALPTGDVLGSQTGPGGGLSGLGLRSNVPPGGLGRGPAASGPAGVRRGKSILGRDEDQLETAINVLKRGVSIRRNQPDAGANQGKTEVPRDLGEFKPSSLAPGPVDAWMIYAFILTCFIPPSLMRTCGLKTPEQQRAWREKIGLLGVVSAAMAFVGFLTFGFTQTVCGTPANRYVAGSVDTGSSILYGIEVDMNDFFHPQVGPFGADTMFNHTNPAYSDPWLTGGKDISLLFQKVDGRCAGLITAKSSDTALGGTSPMGGPANYFPCSIIPQNASRASYSGTNSTQMCHPQSVRTDMTASLGARDQKSIKSAKGFKNQGTVYYTWENLTAPERNLVVYKQSVLDLDRLLLLKKPMLNYPAFFDQLYPRNATWAGKDVSSSAFKLNVTNEFDCLEQIVGVGQIDSKTIGCVASSVELYLSLVFILGVVLIRFFMAVIFGWCLSWRLGAYGKNQTPEQRKKRRQEIETWSSDIYRPAPARYRPNAKKHALKKHFLPSSSRFSHANANKASVQARLASEKLTNMSKDLPVPSAGLWGSSRSTISEVQNGVLSPATVPGSRASGIQAGSQESRCPFPPAGVVPQPAPDYMPFSFPLAHSICLVTAYSESFEGLRTTLDSLATTDYPNSHKILLVIADGIVKGEDSELSTPDICLSLMKDLIVPAEDVEGHSYVAIADGHKRHNMAKVYAGWYDYDNSTVERSKQQRVPMILVAKCGSPLETDAAKPGNRGKRDSQMVLMAFLQKVMFDERMTMFEYEFFNAIWRTSGVPPDKFEIILMVDADTKVFPDALSRMVSCMVEDPEIMGLCGETKVANKSQTWVTMIQVFEYYISHHSQKACEACFGGVTCLPGCFSAYRIKAPKGPNGYWVPILANPDVVEHYSENVVDTLHKKNLLLLGEDRYLTTLMLKTFPKRKMMFVPQAVCKTLVPDTFKVLLSQRRRWINSTVHNLFELVLVNELCGVFCLSMRFMIAMELVGTLVLPAALAFTFYVAVIAVVNAFTGGPIPTIPLVLLAIILGLPGVLIVVTSRKWSYVGWMLIYLLSLPMWNLILPSYAFWHFDDFSWGATRLIQGEGKKDAAGDHSGAEGHFDPSNIVMQRWADWERERRLRAGITSVDSRTISMYDSVVLHNPVSSADTDQSPPIGGGGGRYSMASTSDTHAGSTDTMSRPTTGLLSSERTREREDSITSQIGGGFNLSNVKSSARARLDNVPLLELPAPLAPDAANRPPKGTGISALSPAPAGSITVARPPRNPSPLNESFYYPAGQSGGSQSPLNLAAGPGITTNAAASTLMSAPDASLGAGITAENPFADRSPAMIEAQRARQALQVQQARQPPPQTGNLVTAGIHGGGVSLVDQGPVPSATEGTMRPVKRASRRHSSQ